MFLYKYCFPDCLKVSHVVQVYKNVRKWSIVGNYRSIRLVAMREVWHFLTFLVGLCLTAHRLALVSGKFVEAT